MKRPSVVVLLGPITFFLVLPVLAQNSSFSSAQWIAPGIYSAAQGATRVLFYTGSDCPNAAPERVFETQLKGTYTLLWNGDPSGTMCMSDLAERSDYEASPTNVVPWLQHDSSSTVDLDTEDHISSKGIVNGPRIIVVTAPERIGNSVATISISITDAKNVETVRPLARNVSASAVNSDMSQERLPVSALSDGFLIEIPTSLHGNGFRGLVKVDDGTNTFVFPFFIPAYVPRAPKTR